MLSIAAIAGGALGCKGGIGAVNGSARLRLLAEARWPHRLAFQGTTVGGLSGIDYDAERREYLLLSDDRSDLNPVRFYGMRWTPGKQSDAPHVTKVMVLEQSNNTPWPSRRHAVEGAPVPDPEAVRWRPDTGTLLWTSEGDERRGFGPALYESNPDGTLLREIQLPAMFQPSADGRHGTRDNLGLEGLTLTHDSRHAWVAMENALIQDGPIPTFVAAGGPCRFTRIEISTGVADRQIAYVPDAIPTRPLIPWTHADNGVSEVLMIDADRMLVLERAYATGVGNSVRLYEIDTRDATDILSVEVLKPDNHRPAPKKLVANFASLGLSRVDNTEGLCWGPDLPNGNRLLIAVSDDNFNPLQITQFAAFEFTG
jgi:hypothetical protein